VGGYRLYTGVYRLDITIGNGRRQRQPAASI